jgi:hypothetical protein
LGSVEAIAKPTLRGRFILSAKVAADAEYLGGQVPYIKDADFARVTELTQLLKELGEKENHSSIPEIADRVLKIMAEYEARFESHNSAQNAQMRQGRRN